MKYSLQTGVNFKFNCYFSLDIQFIYTLHINSQYLVAIRSCVNKNQRNAAIDRGHTSSKLPPSTLRSEFRRTRRRRNEISELSRARRSSLRASGNKKERRKERCEDETASKRELHRRARMKAGSNQTGSRRRGARRRYPRNKSPF